MFVPGNRQNDPRDERRRSQMAAARQVLERSTLMLLVSTKSSLRHPDCIHAKENRDTVFCQMRRAMDLIHYVVKDGILAAAQNDRRGRYQQQSMDWDTERGTASSCLRIFARLMESSRPRFNSVSGTSVLNTPKTGLKDISSTHEGIISERRELMRSNSERDRHMTNHHTTTMSHRKTMYREPNDYHNTNNSNGIKGNISFIIQLIEAKCC